MSTPVRYVCLSDMHLGGNTSLLTEKTEGGVAGSEVLAALVACLRAIRDANDGHPFTLVLAGDIFELALASDENSATVFQEFMAASALPGDELFDSIRLLPGNHDHHLWETSREHQFAQFLTRHPSDPIPHPLYSTLLFTDDHSHPVQSPLLSALMMRGRGELGRQTAVSARSGPSIEIAYPNFGVTQGDRCVVFHHGHFVEPAYHLLTNLNTALFDGPVPETVSALEEGNFAWIQFFWSALGRAGAPGKQVQYIYDRIRDPEERAELVDLVSRRLALLIRNRTPHAGIEDGIQERVLHFLLDQAARWGDSIGRRAYYGGASKDAAHDRGIREYLERYVRQQIDEERPGLDPEVTFVFGHTHHPMAEVENFEGYGRPVRLYNTGGWVHETKEPQRAIGASMVVIGDALDVVSINLFREVDDVATRYPTVTEVGTAGPSPLYEHVVEMLDHDAQPWGYLAWAIEKRLLAS